MTLKQKKYLALTLPAVVVIAIDQWSKYMIRTHPGLQHWDIIKGVLAFHYTENPGMALGMEWATTPVISIVAILATTGILIYILKSMQKANISYLLCMGLILGGAAGNIIDRLMMAEIQSYGGVLDGHVIDFIHFTVTMNGYPVFPYIFNVADVSISTAIILLLLFHNRILPAEQQAVDEIDEAGLESSAGISKSNPGAGTEHPTPPQAPSGSGPWDVAMDQNNPSDDSKL